MGRSAHFLERVTADRYPLRLVALDVESTDEQDQYRPALVRERLACWSGKGYNKDHRGNVREWEGSGTDKASWWKAVQWVARRPGLTWLVTNGVSRAAGLLGFWEMIEKREAILDGRDERDRQDSDGRCVLHQLRGAEPAAENRSVGRTGNRLPQVQGAHPGGAGRGELQNRRRIGHSGFACLEDPPTIVRFRLAGYPGSVQWTDVRNYGIERTGPASSAQEGARDVYWVMQRMLAHLKWRGWGSLMPTASSQALHTLRRAHLRYAMLCHDDPVALALERAAYVGGRCEARRLGEIDGPVFYIDVRSMYGWVASVQALPAVFNRRGEGNVFPVPQRANGEVDCVAEVEVETEEPAYPAPLAGQSVFPVGRFWTTLCGPELADAIAHNRVRQVGRWAQYHLSPCLSSYANDVFAARMQAKRDGDEAIEQWLKAMLVGVVGKLGQRGWRWEFDPSIVPVGPWCQWPLVDRVAGAIRQRSLGWQCQREVREDWANDAIPAIAAWVCSAARMRLLETIRVAGWNEVLYYDTDSLILSGAGFARVAGKYPIGQEQIGSWRLCTHANRCHIFGQKHYRIGGRDICAGLPRGEHQRTESDEVFWFREWLRRAIVSGRRPEPSRRRMTYVGPTRYRAGIVGEGGIVHPFRLGG